MYNTNLLSFQQYSSALVQYKDEYSDFGNFDPKEVQKEIRRGQKLVRYSVHTNVFYMSHLSLIYHGSEYLKNFHNEI